MHATLIFWWNLGISSRNLGVEGEAMRPWVMTSGKKSAEAPSWNWETERNVHSLHPASPGTYSCCCRPLQWNSGVSSRLLARDIPSQKGDEKHLIPSQLWPNPAQHTQESPGKKRPHHTLYHKEFLCSLCLLPLYESGVEKKDPTFQRFHFFLKTFFFLLHPWLWRKIPLDRRELRWRRFQIRKQSRDSVLLHHHEEADMLWLKRVCFIPSS